MAGANQHDIPQALSRGFRIPGGSKKGSKTWLYEKGVAPRLVRIKDEVAVEPHFYSEPPADGSKTLDDQITDYENAFAQRLQAFWEILEKAGRTTQVKVGILGNPDILKQPRREMAWPIEVLAGHVSGCGPTVDHAAPGCRERNEQAVRFLGE